MLASKPQGAAKAPGRKRVKLSAKPLAAKKPKKAFSMVVGSGSLVSVLALFFLLLAWGAGMTLVLLFSDKLSSRLIAQNSELQDAYEQRLQAYRDEIARLVSEQAATSVDRDSVVGRVKELLRNQRAIENRLEILRKIADQIGVDAAAPPPSIGSAPPGGAVSPPTPPPRPGFPTRPATPGQTRGDVEAPFAPQWAAAPPEGEPFLVRVANLDRGRIDLAQATDAPIIEFGPTPVEIEVESDIARLEAAMQRMNALQARALAGLVRQSEVRLTRFRSALGTLGLTPEEVAPETGRTVTNLPAIVAPIAEQNTPFGQRVNQIRGNVSLLSRLQPALTAMPLNRPTALDARFSSPFGYRIHPISGVSKLHAGLDLAAPVGTAVRAAGSGVVLSAGWGGGYGNLVQIDHGNGVVTRYAHLSAIEVAQGQPIALGAEVGKMGSTGASTGSHLHFETRIKGTPANPACFLIAGDKLRDAPSPGFTCDKVPFTKGSQSSSEEEDDDS